MNINEVDLITIAVVLDSILLQNRSHSITNQNNSTIQGIKYSIPSRFAAMKRLSPIKGVCNN